MHFKFSKAQYSLISLSLLVLFFSKWPLYCCLSFLSVLNYVDVHNLETRIKADWLHFLLHPDCDLCSWLSMKSHLFAYLHFLLVSVIQSNTFKSFMLMRVL